MTSTRNSTSIPYLIVICGPTATGKTGLSLAIAQRWQPQSVAILSADSRQVYRQLDIGTAKPSVSEQQQVPHYLIDIRDPVESLTLAEYQREAQHLIAKFHASPTVPLLVGGTGLYVRAVVRGLKIPAVPPQLELRSQLASLGQSQCYEFLQQLDPASAQRIHANDQVRTLRALEIYYVSGQTMSAQQGEDPPDYPILQIGLDCDVPALNRRIEQRTQRMFASGLVEEVKALRQAYGADLPLLKTLGYGEVSQYLDGTLTLEAAMQQTVIHTRQFAKRQRTWFRADDTIHWFDAADPHLVDQVWQQIQQFVSVL